MTQTSGNCMQPDLYCEAYRDLTLRCDCNNRGCVFNKNFNQK